MRKHLKRYAKDVDNVYIDSTTVSASNLRKGIQDLDDEMHGTDDPDLIEQIEDEITICQEMLKCAQHNIVFVENTPPSLTIVPALREHFTDDELESILKFVQSEEYIKFMDVSYKAELEYNDAILKSVDEFSESLQGRVN